jgi:hypothetical protein
MPCSVRRADSETSNRACRKFKDPPDTLDFLDRMSHQC